MDLNMMLRKKNGNRLRSDQKKSEEMIPSLFNVFCYDNTIRPKQLLCSLTPQQHHH